MKKAYHYSQDRFHRIYLSVRDMMYHVQFYDNYDGTFGWHRNDDFESASGFDTREEATAWAVKRSRDLRCEGGA
jgi:hypothetical protein